MRRNMNDLAEELADAAMSIFSPEGDRSKPDEDPGYLHSFNKARAAFLKILKKGGSK